ncbi:MAG: hypothetical protein KatS3mg111_1163 [Pirellulaceae bacterium]|nr:MAG: hypothetical protein KatS3mg111_1163 [Pirellulaceae bacterium]
MKTTWRNSVAVLAAALSGTAMAQMPSYPGGFGPSSYPPPASFPTNLPQVPPSYFASQTPTAPPQIAANGQPGSSTSYYTTSTGQGGAAGAPHNYPPGAGSYTPQASPPMQMVSGGAYGNTFSPAAYASPQVTAPPATVPPPAPQAAPAEQVVAPPPYHGAQVPAEANYAHVPQQQVQSAPADYGPAPNCSTCGPAPVSGGYYGESVSCTAAPWGQGAYGRHLGLAGSGAKNWFASAGALVFQRIDNHNQPLTFSADAYAPDLFGTESARQRVAGGVETTVGRYFHCGRHAVALTYWGIFPGDETSLAASGMAGDFRTRIPFGYLDMPGTPGDPNMPEPVIDWFNNSYTHMVHRSFEYHNVEINLLGFAMGGAARSFSSPYTGGTMFRGLAGCTSCGGAGCATCRAPLGWGGHHHRAVTGPCSLVAPACGSRLNVTWLAGFRYFRFRDNILYAASLIDPVITRSNDDLYYEVDTTNDLYGFQLGSQLNYCINYRWSVYGGVKAGVYGNRSRMFSWMGTDYYDAYLNDTRMPANPDNGTAYRFDVTKNDVAFLSELSSGITYRITPAISAIFGYRAVIASGVATAPDNFRETFANYAAIRDFDNRGTLILHGFNIGGAINY